MDLQILDALTAFCAHQRYDFDPAAWLLRSESDGRLVAVVAQYLAMTSWYGHGESLRQVAEKIEPGISTSNAFADQLRAVLGLNLARFSVRTRCTYPLAQR